MASFMTYIKKKKHKKTGSSKCWQGSGKTGTLVQRWWEYRMVQLLWKTIWRFLKQLNVRPGMWLSSRDFCLTCKLLDPVCRTVNNKINK
jgi:hypothetical protein